MTFLGFVPRGLNLLFDIKSYLLLKLLYMINPLQTYTAETSETNLKVALQKLLDAISQCRNLVSLVFFGDATHINYNAILSEIRAVVRAGLGYEPLISFIPQSVCGEAAYALEATGLDNAAPVPDFKQTNDVRYAVFGTDWGKILITEAVSGDDYSVGYAEQATCVFEKLRNVFRVEQAELRHIVRQWNYIGDIVGFENGNQHYQLFNNARTAFYEDVQFENGFPAATGISMNVKSLLVSLIAVVPEADTRIYGIDNSLQKPAWNYSEKVLVEGENIKLKTTPKFERGKLIVCKEKGVFFVSGTAAIRDEKSSFAGDVAMQTRETIENINYLISKENQELSNVKDAYHLCLAYVRVYLKNRTDYAKVKRLIDEAWPELKSVFVEAEVCRPELLVEIEGIAN